MFKKLLVFSILFVFSSLAFAQNEQAAGTKPREELSKDFVKTLSEQNEDLLITTINSGSPQVKVLCFEALASKGASSEKAVKTIDRYLTYGLGASGANNSDVLVRHSAAKAAAATKSETLVSALSDLIYRDQATSNLIAAAYALGEIGNPKGTGALLFQLRLGKSQAVVYETAVALGKIGDPAAMSDLVDLAQDERYFLVVRQAAIDAIKKIKPAQETN